MTGTERIVYNLELNSHIGILKSTWHTKQLLSVHLWMIMSWKLLRIVFCNNSVIRSTTVIVVKAYVGLITSY